VTLILWEGTTEASVKILKARVLCLAGIGSMDKLQKAMTTTPLEVPVV
jgi:hypothetical protein